VLRRCFVIGITASSANSAPAPLERFEAVEPHLGTLVSITAYAPSVDQARAAFRRAYARIAQLNQILSDYLPTSELNQISTQPRRLSPELAKVLRTAQKLAQQTNGAFDVTAGALIQHWRKTKTFPPPNLPVGHQHLHLKNRTAWLDDPAIRLDLGALGKGYIADEALKALALPRALIAISGDIVCGAPPPGQPGWRVQAAGRVFIVKHAALSTAGDAEQFTIIDGQRYSHILDPRTRRPLSTPRQVTVLAPTGLLADALDTAICITNDPTLTRH
jgi:FAD:protein FMN transferase